MSYNPYLLESPPDFLELQKFLSDCTIHENFAHVLSKKLGVQNLKQLKNFVQITKNIVSRRLPMQPDPEYERLKQIHYQMEHIWNEFIIKRDDTLLFLRHF